MVLASNQYVCFKGEEGNLRAATGPVDKFLNTAVFFRFAAELPQVLPLEQETLRMQSCQSAEDCNLPFSDFLQSGIAKWIVAWKAHGGRRPGCEPCVTALPC